MNTNEPDTARPRFFMDAIENKAASLKEGRPIFEEKEMVEVRIPGDRLFNWIGEVTDKERGRWPEIYAAFKRGEERAASGTPLEEWPPLTKGRVAELKAQNILSVEELATVPDNALPKIGMGARELREQARSYLAQAKGGADVNAMAAELARLKDMVVNLTNMTGSKIEEKTEPEKKTSDKALEECTDAELKEYIKRETGEAPRGNISRVTLLRRAADIAKAEAA